MKRMVLAFFAFAVITIPAPVQVAGQQPAQSRCSLTETSSPSVRGIRLGMNTEQVLALFPGISKKNEMKDAVEKAKTATRDETVYLSFDPATDASGDKFAGVDSVSVGLSKGRVVDFSVQYGGPSWRTVDEWVGKLSESFNLPGAQNWAVGPNESPNKVLKCAGIEIEAAIQGGGGSIRIRNTAGAEERPAAGEAKKRREFKP